MKILIVSEPNCDGVFRHVEGLIRHLLAAGDDVIYAYSSRRSCDQLPPLLDDIMQAGGRTVDLQIGNNPAAADLWALGRIAGLIRKERPDVVHAHSSKAGALVRVLAPFFPRIPFFYTAHAYYGMGMKPGLKARFFWAVEASLAGFATTINISRDEQSFAKSALGLDERRAVIIPNPVASQYEPATAADRSEARKSLGITADRFVFGTIGRMVEQKDPENLYRAYAETAKEFPDTLLVHVGSGPKSDTLIRLSNELGIQDRLLVIPYLARPKSFYHAIDGFVLSSAYEAGWPIVILEAMACDLSVATTTCPGMSDIGQAGLNHLAACPPGDIEALVEALRQIRAKDKTQIASNHRTYVREHFSPDICYGKVRDLYAKV